MTDTTQSRPIPKPRRNIQIASNDRGTKYENVTIKTEIFDTKGDHLHDEISIDATDNVQGVYKKLMDDLNNIEDYNLDTPTPVAAPRRPPKPIEPIKLNNNYNNNKTAAGSPNNFTKDKSPHKESNNNLKNYVKNETNKETNKSKSTFHVAYQPPAYTETVEPELSRGHNLRKSFSPSNSTGSTHSSSNEHIPKYKNDSPRNSYSPDDDESNDSQPSDLLKSLGATSKLLTASIGERISVRTKGAKHKMDKSLKISREKLGSWGHETSDSMSNKLKNVKTKISSGVSGFSLGRDRKPTDNDESNGSMIDDEMLKNISFNSPLNNNKNTIVTDACYETPKKNKPVVQASPRSGISSQYSSFNSSPISLTDSDTSLSLTSSKLVFERNDRTSRSFYTETDKRNNRANSNDNNLYKNKSESNIYKLSTTMEEKIVVDSASSNESLPCPTIPAPVLTNREEMYGKIRPSNEIKSPARPPRIKKKSYENVEIRVAGVASSTRATIDSADIFSRNIEEEEANVVKTYPNIFSRQVNKIYPEGNTNRSDSWKFYDTTEERENSSPEPVYENSEPMYGKLFEMDSTDKYLLQPQSRNSSKLIAPNMYKHDDDFDCFPSTSSAINERKINNSNKLTLPRDILKEFDPLLNRSMDNLLQDNNNLLLLEDLLNVDTYGKSNYQTTDVQSLESFDSLDDLHNDAHSDEVLNAPTPPERSDSLNVELNEPPASIPRQPKPSPARKKSRESIEMMIIHQNMKLRSESMENVVDEATVQQYLSQTNETEHSSDEMADLSRPGASRSNWFLDGSEENYLKQQQNNSLNCNDKNSVDKIVKTVPKLSLYDENEPPPPSYFDAISKPSVPSKPKMVPETSPPPSPSLQNKPNSSVKNMFSSVLNLGRKNSVRNPLTRSAIQMIAKPMLSQRYIHHEGHLIRFPTRVVEDILKELSPRNAELREKRFTAYLDPQHKTVKEQFLLEYIITIQCVDNQKISNTPDMHCFELTVGLPKNQSQYIQTTSNPNMIISSTNSGNVKTSRVCHVYGVAKRSERNLWMQKLIESMTEIFPQKYTCEYTRAGWCYLKTSITSAWSGAWILLSGRKFLFYTSGDENKEVLDLRKARCIVLKEHDESINNLHVEEGPLLMIDCPPYTLYMIMNCPRETKVWRHIIKESAHNNGTSLKRQQLTKDNVPVIVDKCVNFIYANGSMSEGIYRKAGSENAIERLLAAFRSDAFSVQLIRNEFTEHDVSNALKRFMREMPERLLEKYASGFLEVSRIKLANDKILEYKNLLENLSIIEYATLRKLIGHLNFIQSQKHVNKMGVSNLSLIWGIALLRKNKDDTMIFHEQDAKVVADLITLYKNLFPLTADEIAKEQIMLSVLQKYHAAAENLSDTVKQSGDLKIWITIDTNPDNTTEEKRQINVSLTPTKTVYDICKELAGHMKLEPYKLTLKEVILNGDLYRPMHYTERVLDTVLKWTYWQDADRKDNYLKVVPTKFLEYIDRTIKSLGSVIPNSELKFADNKTRGLKQFTLELIDDRIVVMKKEKQTVVKVKEILLSDVTTYVGHEKKRDLTTRWSITLLDNKFKKRNRESPFIGHVIAGTNLNDLYVWYSFIMYSLHKRNILPGPEIIMT